MAWKLKSIWYRPPSLNTKLNDRELSERFHAFHDWYRETHGKNYNPEPVFTETPRNPIIKAAKIIGKHKGKPIEIRIAPPAHAFPYHDNIYQGEASSKGVICPALHIVIWQGKRIDAFLSAKRAKECALSFISKGN